MKTSATASTARSSEPIGFIGLGAMGAPMARHLASVGHRLLVHDINPRAVQSVVDCGARAVASPKAIASEAAQLMQQINGSLFATLLAVSCEAFVAGAKAGLDPLTMTKILGIETGRNAASARIIPEQVATRKFDHGKRIEEACRDLSLLSDEARRLGVTPWILDKVRLLYGLAAQLGSPRDDITRLITHYEKWANVEVTSGPAVAAPVASEAPRLAGKPASV